MTSEEKEKLAEELIKKAVGKLYVTTGLKRKNTSLQYIFKCERDCGRDFKLPKGHFHRYNGICFRCSQSDRSRKRVYPPKKPKQYRVHKILYINCPNCGKLAVTPLRRKKKFCGKACQRFYENNFNRGDTLKKRFAIAKACANRTRSKRKFYLTFEEYCEVNKSRKCDYCEGNIGRCGTGMDRLDSSKEYEMGNVVPCCKRCNILKGDFLSPEETKKVIEFIREMRGGKVWE